MVHRMGVVVQLQRLHDSQKMQQRVFWNGFAYEGWMAIQRHWAR